MVTNEGRVGFFVLFALGVVVFVVPFVYGLCVV